MLYDWYKVEGITFSSMREEHLQDFEVADKEIGLLKRDNKVYAFAATCPHASARLCEGWLDAQGRIVCPDHKYRFDAVNGRNTSGEGYKLKTYPVEIREDYIYIGLLQTT
ncbi:MAG: Rieske 2Fe-2S domain-containing protein [Bacteroidetes bacterium]|nr:Rieske 2Fe-2S domain-containing protein [Bacteroidota bacterium]